MVPIRIGNYDYDLIRIDIIALNFASKLLIEHNVPNARFLNYQYLPMQEDCKALSNVATVVQRRYFYFQLML